VLLSPFIVSPDYGTRCSTLLLIDKEGAARFIERTFYPAGEATGEVEHRAVVADLAFAAAALSVARRRR
jgi:uncharacterized protein with NRDE domain